MFSESFRVVTADRPSMIQAESTRRLTSITAIRAHKKASLHHERRRREGTGGDGRGRGMGRDLFREEPLLTCRLKRVMSYCFISESRSHPSTCCLFFPCWCMAPCSNFSPGTCIGMELWRRMSIPIPGDQRIHILYFTNCSEPLNM